MLISGLMAERFSQCASTALTFVSNIRSSTFFPSRIQLLNIAVTITIFFNFFSGIRLQSSNDLDFLGRKCQVKQHENLPIKTVHQLQRLFGKEM